MKKRVLFLSLATVLCVSILYGQVSKEVVVTSKDAGQSFVLNNDEVLTVQLRSNPSTGYGWFVKDMDRAVVQQFEGWDFTPDQSGGIVGSPGVITMYFKGVTAGKTSIQLIHHRPWEKEVEPMETFNVSIISEGAYTGSFAGILPPNRPVDPTIGQTVYSERTGRAVPAKFSWKDEGGMTKVGNQGSCGSCWAWASCATLEANIKITDKATRDLSEQYLVNCGVNRDPGGSNNGCSGGWATHNYWKTYGGVYETDEPYKGVEGTCKTTYPYHEKIDNYGSVSGYYTMPTAAKVKQALYDYGPLWCGIYATSALQSFSGGIFTTDASGDCNHAITVCGWDDTDATPYWVFKNSWGSGWCESGYMRIKQTILQVTYASSYLVYKGGIAHDAPPVANFKANPTQSCDGKIQFTDQSNPPATSWEWNFGDNTTSTQQNPLHTYATSGTFTVILKATNQYGNDSETKSSYITVTKPAKPTATGGSGWPGTSLTLTASGTGTLKWYDVATGGTVLGTGTTFNTPSLIQDKTYYVEAATGGAITKGGKAAQGTGGYLTAAGAEVRGLVFDVLKPTILKSVKVYSQTAGNRVIQVLDAPETGNEIASTTVNIPTGEQVVTLNFSLPAGTNYHLKVRDEGTVNMWRDNVGASYPYNISNLVSIKYSNTNDPVEDYTYYYYFYDWSVAEPECVSDRTSCIANVWTVGIDENGNEKDFGVYPNPSNGKFNISLMTENENVVIRITNMEGQNVYTETIHDVSGEITRNIDLSGYAKGLYNVTVNTNSKTYQEKILVE